MSIKEQRRREILEAAIKVFSKHGFDRAKIAEIAEVAGIGKGTIYEYFKSKKELFECMIKCTAEEYIEALSIAMNDENTVREKLVSLSKSHMEFMSSNIDILQMVANSNEISKEIRYILIDYKMSVFKLVDGVLEKGIKAGELRGDLNKEVAVYCIIGSVNQYYINKIFINRVQLKEYEHEEVIDMLLKGFTPGVRGLFST